MNIPTENIPRNNDAELTSLLEVSMCDKAGVSCKTLDHVYAEEAGQ